MNLLVLNQKFDPADSGLEVAWEWVGELAARVSTVWVITHEAGAGVLPENVRVLSIGKERHFGRIRKAGEFYAALYRVLREGRVDACFVHMVPLFAVMAAPALKMRGIPMVQWYTHSATSLTLRAALALVDRVATASRESFLLPSSKVVVTGHGIDTCRFRPEPLPRETASFHVLTVGRLSPSKRHDRLIEAVERLHRDRSNLRLTIVGEPQGPGGTRWLQQIRQQIERSHLQEIVTLVGGVARSSLPAWYNRADVCVNLSETNSLDKAVLEAMSCGVPVITSNPAFRPLLSDFTPALALPDSRPESVAAALESVAHLDGPARQALGTALRARVLQHHDLRSLMDRLVALLSDLRRQSIQ